MTLTNAYATLEQLRVSLGIRDSDDDDNLENSIAAASRQIDGFCGRRFWQDATVVNRVYEPDNTFMVCVDDISTATGLVVKIDVDFNATYETTLTLNTDFTLEPSNAQLDYPVAPYTELRIQRTTTAYWFPKGWDMPTVQVTAKFGWPAVPDDVTKACLIQATQLFKAKDAVFGAIALGDSTAMRVGPSLNPMAQALLAPYRKPSIG